MMITKIAGIGLIGTFLSIVLKKYRPEIASSVAIVTGIVIFAMVSGTLDTVIRMLEELCDSAGVNSAYFGIILKIIGIAYISQLASSMAKDAGEGAIASKVELGGKMCIVAVSAPILLSLVDLVVGLVP